MTQEQFVTYLENFEGIHPNCGNSIAHVLGYHGVYEVRMTKNGRGLVFCTREMEDGGEFPVTMYRMIERPRARASVE